MARPIKTGLNYFPLDVDIFNDRKVALVSAAYGLKSEAIIIRLLTMIFRNSYYIEWSDEDVLLFLKTLNGEIDLTYLKNVVNELIERKFFDKTIYENHKVLTSKGIQKRFVKACQIGNRKVIEIERDLDLMGFNTDETRVSSGINLEETPINSEETPINSEFSTQSKVKKSKVEEVENSKVNERPTIDQVIDFATEWNIPENTAKEFYFHYEAQGWVTSGNNPRSFQWQSKLRQWYLNEVKQYSSNYNKSKADSVPEFKTV